MEGGRTGHAAVDNLWAETKPFTAKTGDPKEAQKFSIGDVLTHHDEIFMSLLLAFGEVRFPSPAFLAAIGESGDDGPKLVGVDMGEEAFSDRQSSWAYVKFIRDMEDKIYQLSGEAFDPNSKFASDYAPVYDPIYTAPPAPTVAFLEDDQEEILSLRNALDTASFEMVSKMIVGIEPMSAWDDLQKQLKSIGVDRYVDLYNKSYAASK